MKILEISGDLARAEKLPAAELSVSARDSRPIMFAYFLLLVFYEFLLVTKTRIKERNLCAFLSDKLSIFVILKEKEGKMLDS